VANPCPYVYPLEIQLAQAITDSCLRLTPSGIVITTWPVYERL
jgi:hypothetical protein